MGDRANISALISIGQSIGNYTILSKLGTGGMGAVYLAAHPLIGKKVALKVIHSELASHREVVSRFFQEAKAVNQIGSEHIIEIHDFGTTADGDHFFIMEYLAGTTLASMLATERAIHPSRATHIAIQISIALGAAHACGILHRDLKPDNVMLLPRHGDPDFVKVLDFGLAKVFQSGDPAPGGVQTAVGVLLGTPHYMSPEACESRKVDHRTDIYALGVLLFQMMTGVLPFRGETFGEVLVQQVTVPPPAPRGLNPDIPPALEQVLLRCLAKDPAARFQTMSQLADALRDPDAYLRASPPILPAMSIAPGAAGVDASQVRAYAEARTKERAQTAGLLAQPTAANPHTMRIATPAGFVSGRTRRVWPWVLVGAFTVGGGAGAIAVAMRGGRDVQAAIGADALTVTITAGSAPAPTADAAAVPVAATAPATDAATDAAPTSAQLSIDSTPSGAQVLGADHKLLGKTPLALTMPLAASPVSLELHLKGYRPHIEQLAFTGDVSRTIALEPQPTALPLPASTPAPPQAHPPANHPPHPGSSSLGDGLIRPGDL